MEGRVRAILSSLLLGAWMSAAAAPTWAATFDGSENLICAFMYSFECHPDRDCKEGTSDDVVIADFVRIDFESKVMVLLDEERRGETTQISRIEKLDNRLILQGVEAGRAWSLSIDHGTGDLVLSISGEGTGFVVFGECTKP